ncbi:saccharopine dehydrogenase family protein [Brenneria corticis]|uniref:Saccharopine dehydrogenase NADP binding domain-containing protein n=1 Tax=Brenneria corticis TaxID=2173106 RepID=A0A2U1UAV3_9GAMM|nr:saccharopine dehydrogenase NADP-binding domain-containing protein [Brenneria sp. CFCC 11842]PWC18816.1 hypothetical protein DDT56_02330 [Brenneria sp. CFCC 11842]
MKKLMIYGASGYTGRLITSCLAPMGLNAIIAGRNEAKVAPLAAQYAMPFRIFDLDNSDAIDRALTDVSVLLNCAGPFLATARPLMTAALRNGVHYLDTAAEPDSYLLAEQVAQKASETGVMLLPGCGGSVAMLGCLTAYAVERIAVPAQILIALHVSGMMSRGSALSAAGSISQETLKRYGGHLVARKPDECRSFNFGQGAVSCFPVTLPDLITLWRQTAAPDIETFVHISGNTFPAGEISTMPEGPDEAERKRHRYQASVTVTAEDGAQSQAILDTVNGYTFTAMAAAEAARRVQNGDVRPGFQTPAGLFGKTFAEAIADTTITVF